MTSNNRNKNLVDDPISRTYYLVQSLTNVNTVNSFEITFFFFCVFFFNLSKGQPQKFVHQLQSKRLGTCKSISNALYLFGPIRTGLWTDNCIRNRKLTRTMKTKINIVQKGPLIWLRYRSFACRYVCGDIWNN